MQTEITPTPTGAEQAQAILARVRALKAALDEPGADVAAIRGEVEKLEEQAAALVKR